MSAVRPIRWWTAAERDRLAAGMLGVARAWASEWSIRAPASASCVPQDHDASADDTVVSASTNASRWRVLGADLDGASLAWTPDDAAESVDFNTLWPVAPDVIAADGGRSAAPLAHGIVALALEAWRDAVRTALRLEPASGSMEPDASLHAQGSGAVRVRVVIGDGTLTFIAAAAAVAAFLGLAPGRTTAPPAPARGATLTPLLSTIAERPVALRLALHGVDIDLGTLCSLAIGDVVRLTHHVDEPALIVDADGETVAPAYLVQQDLHKAVQLCAADSLSSPQASIS